jgi:hypothetical protein
MNLAHGLRAKEKAQILITELLILCMVSLITVRDNGGFVMAPSKAQDSQSLIPMSKELWQYLRTGLNYLETSGKNYPPGFMHPGGKAYGALGLSQVAVMDVIKNSPSLSKFIVEDVFTKKELYEEFAKNYADLLLRHYLGMDYSNMPQEQVFTILQRAWFQGPGLYKKGSQPLLSREERAREYILRETAPFQYIAALKTP